MAMTKPQFSMAMTLDSAWTVDVILSGASFTASVAAGTYYLDGTSLQFFSALAIALTAADQAATSDGTAAWAVSASSTTGQVTIERTGVSKTLTKFDFDTGQGRTCGFSLDSYTGAEGEVTTQTGTTITLTGMHSARYIWQPREYLMRDEHRPQRTVAYDQSVTGRAITDGFGASSPWHTRPLVLDSVKGAVIYQYMADDSAYAATVSGMTAGDPNIALEAFWTDLLLQAQDGTPPTVRLAPDAAAPSTYTNIWMSDKEWMVSMEAALTEQSPHPVIYGVNILAQTVVS